MNTLRISSYRITYSSSTCKSWRGEIPLRTGRLHRWLWFIASRTMGCTCCLSLTCSMKRMTLCLWQWRRLAGFKSYHKVTKSKKKKDMTLYSGCVNTCYFLAGQRCKLQHEKNAHLVGWHDGSKLHFNCALLPHSPLYAALCLNLSVDNLSPCSRFWMHQADISAGQERP